MRPLPITFYAYADDEAEVRDLEMALYDFVVAQRNAGVPVRAAKMAQAVRTFGRGALVRNYFSNGK